MHGDKTKYRIQAFFIVYVKNVLLIFMTVCLLPIICLGCGTSNQGNPGQNNNTQPKQQEQQIQKPEQSQGQTGGNFINAGMYKVGKDITAGEYIIYSSGNAIAYYQVAKDSTGTHESIITNDNFTGTRYVTVSDGQYLEFRSSNMLPLSKAPVQQPVNGNYVSGMYKVGRDIKAGEYKVAADGAQAYYEVRKDSKGGIEGIVTNDNFQGEKYITVKNGQYIKLVDCHLSSK